MEFYLSPKQVSVL